VPKKKKIDFHPRSYHSHQEEGTNRVNQHWHGNSTTGHFVLPLQTTAPNTVPVSCQGLAAKNRPDLCRELIGSLPKKANVHLRRKRSALHRVRTGHSLSSLLPTRLKESIGTSQTNRTGHPPSAIFVPEQARIAHHRDVLNNNNVALIKPEQLQHLS